MSSRRAGAAVNAWFKAQGWKRQRFQQDAWRAYSEGYSGLIHSPTGSGKTLAAWLGPVQQAMSRPVRPVLSVLWITPMRALANDTVNNLGKALGGVGLDWEIDIRTGDTPSSRRKRQRSKPPHALVTTPESLSLLLSYADADHYFRALDAVIVDEWHELLGSKRGVQLQLCLSRLRSLRPGLQVWGLSATLGNLDVALAALLPPKAEGVLISGPPRKPVRVRSLLPDGAEAFPWAGHLGLRLLPKVIECLEQPGTALMFTNTRSQCELWFEAITRERPDWIGRIALHHGAVDRDHRSAVEQLLREGDVRCVVCTSSLDLGVDFPAVDQVIQVGSPKGVARLLQRAGRSGHQPGGQPVITCVPTHALELLEIAAARDAQDAASIEARTPPRLCLDVLSQHLVTLALAGGFDATATLAEVRATHAFESLDDDDWQWVLEFITRGGRALKGYPQYHKVVADNGVYRVRDRTVATRHRMHIGTIVSDDMMRLAWRSGGTLGYIEESFISRLKKQDRFLFAGRLVTLVETRDMTAYVKKAKAGKRIVARWLGSRMPLSSELAEAVLDRCARPGTQPEDIALKPLLEIQSGWSAMPRPEALLVEEIAIRNTSSLFVYPFGGWLANEGLATLLALRLARERPATIRVAVNDYGFELASDEPLGVDRETLRRALGTDNLLEDLVACLNTGELARRQFREIARIAGLVFQGYPGRRKATRQVQASSGLLFDVLSEYDDRNRLLRQAHDEVLERSLEYRRIYRLLETWQQRDIHVTRPPTLTPFSFPLWASRIQAQTISTETWAERVQRMAARLEAKARVA